MTRDTGRPVDYRELSGFCLYDRWLLSQDMRPFIEQAVDLGVTSVRYLLGLGGSPWWQARGPVTYPRPDHTYYDGLPEFHRWLAGYGLYGRCCTLGALDWWGPIPDRDRHYTRAVKAGAEAHVFRVASVLRDVPNVLLEVANEFNQIGFGGGGEASQDIVSLGYLVRAAGYQGLLNGSNENGPNADLPTFARPPFDFVDSHLDRRRGFGGFEWVKRSSESLVVDQDVMPFVSGEPINFGSPAPGRPDGHDNERSPAVALAYAATSRMKRYLTTFHFDGGLNADLMDGDTLACARAWRQGLDLVPWAPDAWWRNGHWAESPFAPDNFPLAEDDEETWPRVVRIFGRSDGYWVSVGHRRSYEPTLKLGRLTEALARIEYGDYECRIWREA